MLVALGSAPSAAAAEKPDELDDRVAPAGRQTAEGAAEPLVRHLPSGARVIIQNQNPFRISIPREELGKDASGIAGILLQVFDPDAAPEGRWKGYGLMELKTERVGFAQARVVSAGIDFEAKAEGSYCLRTVARDRAGNTEQKSDDLRDVQWVVVLDRTPPQVELLAPQGGGKPLEVGSRLAIAWRARDIFAAGDKEKSGAVEVSQDGGRTWKRVAEVEMTGQAGRGDWKEGRAEWQVEGPGTGALLVRVGVRDAAGNRAVAALSQPLAVLPPPSAPQPPPVVGKPLPPAAPPPPSPQARALGAYQNGVIYMTRADLEAAVEQFSEALRLDAKLAPAYLDLSACYLRLYDRDRALGAAYLDLAARVAGDGVKALPDEVGLYYNLAQARYRLGQFEAAAASLEAALAVKPRHIESLYMLALVRAGQKRTGDALVLWRQVAALGGASEQAVERRLAGEAVRWLAEAERSEPRRAAAKPAGAAGRLE